MTSRTIRSAILPVAVLAALSCSKTEDTAPERRLFGDPPIITSVNFDHIDDTGQEVPGFGTKAFIRCDFTEIIVDELCGFGYPDVQTIAGGGWTVDPATGKGSVGNNPTTEPGIFIEGTYGEVIFKVSVTDPNSTTAQNNLLLVGASYKVPDSTTETTLVLFDDGGSTKFFNKQENPTPGEFCVHKPDGSCECSGPGWNVTSGDTAAKDNVWTRRMAFVNSETRPFLKDCILRDRAETLASAPPGTTLTFKIEAVDRQGNLTAWPSNLVGITDSNFGKFACNGDPCGCCYLFTQDASDVRCNNLPGMVGSAFPDGLCMAFTPQ
jgi:hypothetical protein